MSQTPRRFGPEPTHVTTAGEWAVLLVIILLWGLITGSPYMRSMRTEPLCLTPTPQPTQIADVPTDPPPGLSAAE
ncbi:MAG: hypothetical protein GC162_10435 [Planctomycetes bacterium]|nr:hypothetical protein [Planctomycetota bacterium]